MAFFIKASLWVGVALLPGGVLLLPVIYAVHRKEQPVQTPESD